jgi:hypothetical protein
MVTAGGELLASLGWIALALIAIAAIVGLAIWRGRRRGSRTIALDAALTVSGLWVMLSAVGALIIIVKAFTVDWAELNGTTTIWIGWPDDIPCSSSGAPGTLSCGGSNFADFTVGGASLGLRTLATAAQLCTLAFTTIPAAMLAAICFQTLRGRTFSRTVTRVLYTGAICVVVLGIASELLSSIAATVGLREVFDEGSEWYPMSFQLTLTPLPFVGALGLAALAAVFSQGSRLQAERDQLERETEGLV